MNKKKLAINLSKLHPLTSFNVSLEQYQTDSELAADLIWKAFTSGDVEDKVVADLGCGNGILGIGALLLGAKKVYFLDLDKKALEICKKNIELFDFGDSFEFLLEDISDFDKRVDTSVINPPFGVQKRKADKRFLEVAMKLSNNVYSIHKVESSRFIELVAEENGFNVIEIVKKEFLLKKTYKFHTKDKYRFDVGIWILKKLI